MKKLLTMLLTLLLCASVCAAEEPAPETFREGLFEYRVTDEGAVLTNWRWYDDVTLPKVVELPATLGGYPLVGIGTNAMNTYNMPYLDSFTLIIPEGVTYLEDDAFMCCHDADAIHLPASLTEIPEGCFIHVHADFVPAEHHPRFTVENGFLIDQQTGTLLYATPASAGKPLPAVRRIGALSTENWVTGWGETDVTIPEGVEGIAGYAFYDWSAKSLTLPSTLKLIESQAFECFEVVEKPIIIPSSVETVQCGSFGLLDPADDGLIQASPGTHLETPEEFIVRTGEDWWF